LSQLLIINVTFSSDNAIQLELFAVMLLLLWFVLCDRYWWVSWFSWSVMSSARHLWWL